MLLDCLRRSWHLGVSEACHAPQAPSSILKLGLDNFMRSGRNTRSSLHVVKIHMQCCSIFQSLSHFSWKLSLQLRRFVNVTGVAEFGVPTSDSEQGEPHIPSLFQNRSVDYSNMSCVDVDGRSNRKFLRTFHDVGSGETSSWDSHKNSLV